MSTPGDWPTAPTRPINTHRAGQVPMLSPDGEALDPEELVERQAYTDGFYWGVLCGLCAGAITCSLAIVAWAAWR